MKHKMAAISLMAAASCGNDFVAPEYEVHRNVDAQIASQTDVSADRMVGTWMIRQAFSGQPAPQKVLRISKENGDALRLEYQRDICIADEGCRTVDYSILHEASGPGRWRAVPSMTPILFDPEIWVMWMDFDSRTAAIGTPSGEFGWIMDRNSTGGGDRITAARDIMNWFGYDIARLDEVK